MNYFVYMYLVDKSFGKQGCGPKLVSFSASGSRNVHVLSFTLVFVLLVHVSTALLTLNNCIHCKISKGYSFICIPHTTGCNETTLAVPYCPGQAPIPAQAPTPQF